MTRDKIITSLDIGSTTVRVASALFDAKQGTLTLIAAHSEPTLGVRRGQIIDVSEVTQSVGRAFAEAERQAGYSLSRTSVSVSGPHIELVRSVGSIAISRADGEVSKEDVARVLVAARTVSIPQNKEVIHTLPLFYNVDGDQNIQDPIGMTGVRLEVSVILVLASTPLLKSARKAVRDSGRHEETWIFGPRAAGNAVLTKKQKEAGVALLDIGGTTCDIAIFKEGEIVDHAVVPFGGSHITHDIAVGLKTSIEIAERVKTEYGSCFSALISKREKVVLSDWGLEDINISRFALSRICEQRMRSILANIGQVLEPYTEQNELPGGVVLVGGCANLDGIAECAKKELKLPAQRGIVRVLEGTLRELIDPGYASVCGALYEVSEGFSGVEIREEKSDLFDTAGMIDKAKEWFREFLP